MKKAKIMLGAIALFAVVGGALAFKAKNNSFGNTTILFAYTDANTVPAYTAVGKAGCFKPIQYNDATTTAGIQVNASITTFLGDDAVCTTLTTVSVGE